MTILASVLALALLSTLASALDQWGLFGCPDFKNQADSSVLYNISGIAQLNSRIRNGGPFKVIAAAESEASRKFSCITITQGDSTIVGYYENGTAKTVTTLGWDTIAAQFKGKLPLNVMNTPDAMKNVTFTVVSDKNGIMVLKTCKPAFLAHYVSTYILIDNTVNSTKLDMACMASAIDSTYKISSWPKGICA